MGSLADALTYEASATRRGTPCTMGVYLDGLDKTDRAALDGALTNDDVTAAAIARAITSTGTRMAAQTVGRHRAGECACPRG